MLPLCLKTATVEQTEATGASLAQEMLKNKDLPPFVALYGDLGVGKTAFVRGFASVIAPGVLVRSPTFALVNEYRGKEKTLFHFDMYRITDEEDLYSIGYDDYLTREGIILTEEYTPNDLAPVLDFFTECCHEFIVDSAGIQLQISQVLH